MSQETLKTKLISRLPDVATHIAGMENGLLDTAIIHLNALRPKLLGSNLQIVAEVSEYDAPANILDVSALFWEQEYDVQPWATGYVAVWPFASLQANKIILSPPPTVKQINAVGSAAVLHYYVKRGYDDLSAYEEDLVITRAMAEAMLNESIRKSGKPVQLRDGQSSSPKNSTPAALYLVLLEKFEMGCRNERS